MESEKRLMATVADLRSSQQKLARQAEEVADLAEKYAEEKTRAELIRRVQSEGNSLKLIPETDPDQKLAKEASLSQWQTAIETLMRAAERGWPVMLAIIVMLA
jgi:hypothetical protein